MEKSHLKNEFNEEKRKLEVLKKEINEFLTQNALNERDRIRLTRVLQLVERYQPENKKTARINKWQKYLETLYRFLPTRKKTTELTSNNISAYSYLLAEKTIASLRKLRHIDFKFKQKNEFSEKTILNQERSNQIINKEILNTSITLEYEKKNWGIERICLDSIQNHLPSDSKGENLWIRCLVDNKWVSLAEAKQKKNKIKAVRFIDDGVGFDVKNLIFLYSTKTSEKESRGQFGEGIKMVAAAALREGLNLEIESQNWRAKPIAKEVKIFDTRHQKEQTIKQLSFQVEYLADKPMIGSRTTFYQPTKEFIDELMQIENKVLALRENYRPLFIGSTGEIADKESGNLFVKGIFVTKKKTLFSYNFEDIETNRDRNIIVLENLEEKIAKIIEELSDKRLIKTLIQKSILEPTAIESSYYNLKTKYPNLWLEAFYEIFGEDAVLDTGFKIPENLKEKNKSLNKIELPYGIKKLLLNAGVKTDSKVVPEFWNETIPTSLTLEYGKDVWNEERILLDAIQNHLPSDSGGTYIGLRFKTKDGKWHDFKKINDTKNEDIEAIKIYDNGRGYDARLLGFFYSTKESNETSGKFGEGLKMLCLAGLRKGINITLHSQNWLAKPRALEQEINGKKIYQLVFDVTYSTKNEIMDDDAGIYQSSFTTFSNLTPELINEFRQINKKVLAIEKNRPIEETPNGEILSLETGMLYVKDILIPGNHNLLFTYHLPKFEIKNRDRNVINKEELTTAITKIWSEVKNSEVIKSFIFKANHNAIKGNWEDKLEFNINFEPKDKEIWKKNFEEIFGKNAAIKNVQFEDYEITQQNKYVDLELIPFPPNVYKVLQKIGLPTYESRIKELTDVKLIPDEELTTEEKEIIKILEEIDKYLPNNRPAKIKIYERKYKDQKVAAGYSDNINIYLLRDILKNFTNAANVYIHEKTHHNTNGALDVSENFRNYLTLALTQLAIDQLKKIKPDLLKNK